MKLLGAVLILLTTTFVGFEYARRLSERPRQIRQLMSAMQSLEAEMLYGLTPLSEACSNIAKQIPNPISSFYEAFANKLLAKEDSAYLAWEQSLDEVWPNTALLETEKEIMKQFGATLGQQDHEQQKKQIQLVLTHLKREELEARDKQAKYEKMIKSLGFLSGVLVVIVLI
ncbi:stage III sporulation protein AB [Alkalihalobacillus alcalophilus ATCC 27647 = CGMCC 1.3604]|uniref:Stage III sporulation protein AB n=1 Tax=Alkalihalobacillus alcalophilus ATCC 27647 = CGMCC 1.3604 TaxID=1218173 RepID=A0A4S4JXV6_ALKAL|nr:stage III sporulation protein SpoIIIAB [Alkalihalobacillus alcalophilus]MED1561471.1 stage III sporulation protein SpoIIIAB [Alkalihalobacillus alcalophilus]THG88409.1 stage III sporulation protein AB [Alkalihalobacillus alcalophilus ATCC 27647 = CGMCC 1.3604]